MVVATRSETIFLSVLEEFSATPGPRFENEGPFSGELFRRTILAPKFKIALEKDACLFIDLDGTAGYATSFLEESFGGLARDYDSETVLNHIDFKTEDEPYLKEDIKKYIREANNKK